MPVVAHPAACHRRHFDRCHPFNSISFAMDLRLPYSKPKKSIFHPLALTLVVSLLAGYRQWKFIDLHAVNLLYWDQFDIYGHLIEQLPFPELFTVQHGPPRLGLGMILTKFIAESSSWNTRTEGFFIFGILCIAMLLGLALKWRLFKSWGYFDVVIPLIFFSMSQWEIFISAPMMSHGALPVLLIFLYFHAWISENTFLRYASLLLVNFLLVFTGFGVFMGGITVLLLLSEFFFHSGNSAKSKPSLISLLIAGITIGAFFYDYHFNPSMDCFTFPPPKAWKTPFFVGLMLANFCALNGNGVSVRTIVIIVIGLLFLTAFISLWARAMLWGWRERDSRSPLLVASALIGFSLIFACNAAIGRICMGIFVSQAPRYMTLLIPGFFGVYCALLFVLSKTRDPLHSFAGGMSSGQLRAQTIALALFFLLVLNGHRPFSIGAEHPAQDVSASKRSWAACYRRLEDIRRCDAETGFSIYPYPEQTHMKEKLDYMQRNRLNLFSEP